MFGIGFFEILIIMLVILLAFGPEKLPLIAKKFAAVFRHFLDLKEDFRMQVMQIDHQENKEKKILGEPKEFSKEKSSDSKK